MNDFDKDLQDALAQNGKFDSDRAAREMKMAAAEFRSRIARFKRWGWIQFWKVVFALLLCLTLGQMWASDEVPTIVRSGIFAVFTAVALAAFTLWHLVQSTRIGILREIHRLRFELAENNVLSPDAIDLETLRGDVWMESTRRWKRTVGRVLFIMLVLVIGFGWLGWELQVGSWKFGGFGKPVFIGTETDEWRLLPGDTIEVHARLTLNDWPRRPQAMPIALPYKDGRIQSVAAGEVEVPWRATENGEAELDLTAVGAGDPAAPVEVVWTVPLDSVARDQQGHRAVLQSLIPTTEFSLTVVLEEGCGYEIADGWKHSADQRRVTCYRSAISIQPRARYGRCRLGIQRSAQVR
jgi:hypothetical protein